MSYKLKLWDSKRQREKINRPNTLLDVRRTKGPSKSREELAGCGRSSPAGSRRQGGGERGRLGPKDRSPYRAANRPPVSTQRPPEILDGRHPPGGSGRDLGRRRGLGLGTRRAEGAPHLGECALQAPGCLSCLGRGRHKKQVLLWNTRGLEPGTEEEPGA